MLLKIFAVRDNAVGAFSNPMFLMAKGQAIRSFTDEVNRAADDNIMFRHPDHFELWHLGEFDTDSGRIDVIQPVQVVTAREVVIVKQ